MVDPFDNLSSDQYLNNIDNTTASNIPISDFRRNEIRPILPDDGNLFFLLKIHLCFILILIRST
jgi:hypothetical protein